MARLKGVMVLAATVAMTVMMIASLFAPGTMAATDPSWSVGTTWALSGEKDISAMFDGLKPQLLSAINSQAGSPIINELDLNGNAKVGAVFTVTGSDATTYTLVEDYAALLTMNGVMDFTQPLPPAGNYSGNMPANVMKNIRFQGYIAAGVYGTITTVFMKEDMSISSISAAVHAYGRAGLNVSNYPANSYWYDQAHMISYNEVAYLSASMTAEGQFDFYTNVTFTPSLQILKGAMAAGSEWSSSAQAHYSGSYSGFFNAQGMPDVWQEQIFASFQEMGVTSFPINLASLHMPSGSSAPFNNGAFDSTETMTVYGKCIRERLVNDPSLGQVTTKEISLNTAPSFENQPTFCYDMTSGRIVSSDMAYNIPMGSSQTMAMSATASGNQPASVSSEISSVMSKVQNKNFAGGSSSASVPGAPQNIAATAGTGRVSLSWQAPSSDGGSAITGYKVYRALAGESALLANVGASTLNYVDTTGSAGTTYTYYLAAVNAVGTGANSAQVTGTPEAVAGVPGAPQGLTATPGSGNVSLAWQAPTLIGSTPITGYTIYRGAQLLANVGASVSSYVDATGSAGTTYTYYVAATNAAGTGPGSAQASAAPQGVGGASNASTDNTMLYAGIAIAAIAVIVIAVVVMRRKK